MLTPPALAVDGLPEYRLAIPMPLEPTRPFRRNRQPGASSICANFARGRPLRNEDDAFGSGRQGGAQRASPAAVREGWKSAAILLR
jgi:hypothetical protein